MAIAFLWPGMLWSMLLVPALVWGYVRFLRRRRAALRLASLQPLREALAGVRQWRHHLPPVLYLGAVAILLLASARPAAVSTQSGLDHTLFMVVDASFSMGERDVAPSRLAVASRLGASLIASMPSDVKVSVISFGGHADLIVAPTLDHARVQAGLESIVHEPGSGLGTGILAPPDHLAADIRHRVGI